MYRDLFGNPDWSMYNLIGILSYGWIIFFFLCRSTWPACDKNQKRPMGWIVLPLLVHLVGYTFPGKIVGPLLGRNTEFFGYVLVSSIAIVLASVVVGAHPVRWLDDASPLYLIMATMLKIGCFCSGCCNGLPWAYGLYNHLTERREFPIQLVEMVLYGLMLLVPLRHRFAPGRRFAAFLVGYSTVRFVVQFFRTDKEFFSSFHLISVLFLGVGLVLWYVLPWLFARNKEPENADV